jgi:Tol biopolymer transport system component
MVGADSMTKYSLLLALLIGMLLASSCRSSADDPAFGPASFSPAGNLVVFSHQDGGACFIYLGNLSTAAAKRLTKARSGCEADPSFSSDGKFIVYSYASRNDRKSSLFIVNADGSNSRQITPSETDDVYPVFSPDNSNVYFARSGYFGHHSPIAASRQHDFDLFSVDLKNNKVTQLTYQGLYDLRSLCLSPDGKELLISTTRYPIGDLFEVYPTAKPQSAKLVFQPHVPDEPRLTGPTPAFGDACYLPDGLNILMIAASNKGGGNYAYNVYLMSAVTGAIEQLTKLTGMTTGVQASPNGKSATFENEGKMYLLDLQSHSLKPLQWSGLNN